MQVTHSKVSAKTDGGDATLVRPSDWNAGHLISADTTAFIGARAYHSTTQSAANAVVTKLELNTEEFDTDGFHDTVTNNSRFTIPAGLGGKYLVIAATSWDTNTAGSRLVGVFKNNATVGGHQSIGNAGTVGSRMTSSIVLDLVAGDYVEAIVYQDSGGARTVGGVYDVSSQLSIVKLDSGKIGGGIGARVYRTTDQTGIVTATDTRIAWDNESFDTDGFHSNVTNNSRLTVPAGLGGKYVITATVIWDSNATNNRQVGFWKNGAYIGAYSRLPASPTYTAHILADVLDLVPGDYIEVNAYQDSGANRSTGTSLLGVMPFAMMRLDSGSTGSPSQTIITSAGVVTVNTVATWTILGATTGTPGSAGSTASLDPGRYLVRGEYWVNGASTGGAISLEINGVAISGGTRDCRDLGFGSMQGLVTHAGGAMTYQMKVSNEGGTATFGLAGDQRWRREVSIVGPL